jgi:type I restriction enzyme S subunit
LPNTDERKEIAESLQCVDRKLEVHRLKYAALTDLFRALLHQLMTAKIRVHDLDLPEIITPVKEI